MLRGLVASALFLVPAVCSSSIGSVARSTSNNNNTREISVDASDVIGTLKNLQGNNGCNTTATPQAQIPLQDLVPSIADQWPSYGIRHVLIYTWPEVFTGWGKSGSAGDPTRNENYNWTAADRNISFVTSRGAVASIQFQPTNGMNSNLSSPEILGEIGFMIADRYGNGANGSGFRDAIELFDFYAEQDLTDGRKADYESSFEYFAAFAKGVARAKSRAGVGAWASNRVYQPSKIYTLDDPYITRFYAECKQKNIPIKAATFHFTNAQYSLNPYDIKRITDFFRSNILIPAGLPDLPIWSTEYDMNPTGTKPNSTVSALNAYNDPAFYASFNLGVSMYAQDTSLEQALPWTGFGYGGSGAGNAYFPGWFNKTSSGRAVPLNLGAAWKLQGDLVVNASERIRVDGGSSDGFAVLGGRNKSKDEVQLLLNNYQLDNDIPRGIANAMVPLLNSSTTAYPMILPNGLFNGEQACIREGTRLVVPVCQTYLQAEILNNTSNAYHLNITNLPWDEKTKYNIEVQRVGPRQGQVYDVVLRREGTGNSVDMVLGFPPNAQDHVKIYKA